MVKNILKLNEMCTRSTKLRKLRFGWMFIIFIFSQFWLYFWYSLEPEDVVDEHCKEWLLFKLPFPVHLDKGQLQQVPSELQNFPSGSWAWPAAQSCHSAAGKHTIHKEALLAKEHCSHPDILSHPLGWNWDWFIFCYAYISEVEQMKLTDWFVNWLSSPKPQTGSLAELLTNSHQDHRSR